MSLLGVLFEGLFFLFLLSLSLSLLSLDLLGLEGSLRIILDSLSCEFSAGFSNLREILKDLVWVGLGTLLDSIYN